MLVAVGPRVGDYDRWEVFVLQAAAVKPRAAQITFGKKTKKVLDAAKNLARICVQVRLGELRNKKTAWEAKQLESGLPTAEEVSTADFGLPLWNRFHIKQRLGLWAANRGVRNRLIGRDHGRSPDRRERANTKISSRPTLAARPYDERFNGTQWDLRVINWVRMRVSGKSEHAC